MRSRPPAYSAQFASDTLPVLRSIEPIDSVSADWAWGGSTGNGIKVAVIDSGIDAEHPAVGGNIAGYVTIREEDGQLRYDSAPHGDLVGHGNACAGIIRALAPGCELYSVQVLGASLTGRGSIFVAGLRWALENNMQVCNLSLGTAKKEFFGVLHELTDLAYFRNVMLVTAANNLPIPSFPSIYASVISVAAHEGHDPYQFFYNPQPPVEFGAPGIDVHVAWKSGEWLTATGNSFAAPHLTGIVTKILAKHPDLTLFQMKAVLRALSANVVNAATLGGDSPLPGL
ncbi:MAG: S8 family serine peptidase [Chloroflexi bacterium]|nr:S8 family serine peptidase [Chloroflexota bacterium]